MRECRGMFPKYTFNRRTLKVGALRQNETIIVGINSLSSLKCERYAYGGCNGSENLYDSLQECANACIWGE